MQKNEMSENERKAYPFGIPDGYIKAYFACNDVEYSFTIHDMVTGDKICTEKMSICPNRQTNIQVGFYNLLKRIAVIIPIEAAINVSSSNFRELFLDTKKQKTQTGCNIQRLILIMQCFEKIKMQIHVKKINKEVFSAGK